MPPELKVSKLMNTEQATKMLNQKVFSNDLILDCIFGFLNLEDIKRVRQVCRQWDRVTIPFLKKLSLISFRKPKYSVESFNQLFGYSDLGRHFTRVKLTYHPNANEDCEWELNELTELLTARKVNMTELTIEKIMLKGIRGQSRFDLSPHIGPSLTKLDITGFSLMTISTDCCTSTKFLNLSGCSIRIGSGIKINPVELKLYDVITILNGNPQASSINEFVNFDRLKSLSLESCSHAHLYRDDTEKKLSCHFRDAATIEKLDLCGHHISLDFKNANWKVTKKFTLSCADFTEPNEMEFSNFEIKDGSVQLAVLPRNLKKLKIEEGPTDVLCSEPIQLPELEILNVLIYSEGVIESISLFNNCINLTTLMLTRKTERICAVDIDSFPKSVRKLYICGDIVFYGDGPILHLKNLHVKWSNPIFLNSILSRFKGEELAVDLRCQFYESDSLHPTIMDISQKPFGSIAVALNHCHSLEGNNVIACPLSEITNEMSAFYIFANGFGTAIPKSRFESIFEYWEEINQN